MRKIFELAGTITVNGLEAMKKGLQTVQTDLEKADKALTKFGRQTVRAGTILTKNLTAPLAAAGTAMGFLAVKTGEYADHLFDLEQITGLNTNTLQELENVARVAGVDFDGFVNTISKLTNSLPEISKGSGPAADAIKKLGIDIFDTVGNTRDMNELFPEIIKELQKIPNVADRNAIAMDLFGRSMSDLAPVLGLTADQLDAARKEAHDLGLVMSKESLQAADDFRKEVEKLKGQVVALGRGLAVQLMPILKDNIIPAIQSHVIPLFIKFGNAVKSVITFFTNLDPTTKKIIFGFTALVAVMGPALLIFGKSILIVKSLIAAFALLKTAFIGITIAMATNPFTALIAAAGVAVAALVGVKMWMDNVKKAAADREKLNMFGEEIEGLFNRMETRAGRGRQTLDMILDLKKNSIESEKALVQHLSAMAEDYGFIISGTDAQRIKQLKRINNLIKETGNITLAAKAYNEELAKEATNTEKVNNAVADKEELLKDIQAQYDSMTNSAIVNLENENKREREKAQKKAKDTIMDKTELNEALALIDKVYDIKLIDDKMKLYDAIGDITKQAILNEAQFNGEWRKKTLEQDVQNGHDSLAAKKEILRMDKEEAIRQAREKGYSVADIEKYFANETNKLAREKWSEYIDFAANAISQAGNIYMMATQNKIAANDNWYEKEKASIEKSGLNAKKKEKKMEELDAKYNAKRTELQREQAKKEKAIAIFESIIGTASAVVKALPNVALSIIAGVLGALKTAFIIAQPLPFAAGGLVKKRSGGVNAVLGEGREDEVVFPLESGVKSLANKLIERLAAITLPPVPALAFAGGGGAGGMRAGDTHWHVGTLIADERGIKELERRQSQFRISEAQRMGR